MIIGNERLRKISDGVFQEAEPPGDRSRPLEWKRSFNFIRLPLKNIKIVTSCSVHDAKAVWEEEKTKEPLKLVKPDISEQIAITGVVDEDQMRDCLYFAVENSEEEQIYSVERVSGQTNVSIKTGTPSKETERIPAGLFYGTAFRMNYEPGEDYILLHLTIQKELLLLLVSALRADGNSTVEVVVCLLSFSYEVDDALREGYDSRDIIINDQAPCFVSWAGVTSKIGQHCIPADSENADEDEITDLNKEKFTQEKRSYQELLQVLLSYSKLLNRLLIAIWVLIIIVALNILIN